MDHNSVHEGLFGKGDGDRFQKGSHDGMDLSQIINTALSVIQSMRSSPDDEVRPTSTPSPHKAGKCKGPNEQYSHCDGHCDLMCDGSDKMKGLSCSSELTNVCIPGCNCKRGFARNSQGECVKFMNCKQDSVIVMTQKK
ncbi:uncharacterized protein LOC113384758 [Ctenocephalides felis]|uniref:uncharacterized protein LOC113384758 n=1 Tax=Ctenocephalides felis TaxID=7515 RepID=UPI000E6E33BF|nr:uncharacterized protein LOC113384758 [Ctenocephalides felis]